MEFWSKEQFIIGTILFKTGLVIIKNVDE